jgi:hypothetical protein
MSLSSADTCSIAMEEVGLEVVAKELKLEPHRLFGDRRGGDPYSYVVSANIDVLAKLLQLGFWHWRE